MDLETPAAQAEDVNEPTKPVDLSRGQLIYGTAALSMVAMFNAIDRGAIAILVEPIKLELALSDTQIGILTGFAFSLTYALFGIPLARLADTKNRARLLSICLAIWSVATALAGMVTSFFQMIITRVIVGIGEAGGSPSSVSILGDYYSPETRPRGISWFNMGAALGGTLGMIIVGWIAEEYGWRRAFFSMGVPGIALALLTFFTLREPVRGRYESEEQNAHAEINVWQSIQIVWGRSTMRHIVIGFGIIMFGSAGIGAWYGAFFVRSHGLNLAEVGAVIGIAAGLGTFIGAMLGVIFGPWLARRDRRWEIWWPATAYSLAIPILILAFYLDSITWVAILLGLNATVGGSAMGMLISGMHSVLPAHVRAMGMALIMFASNLVGAGVGPLLVGVVSDALAPQYGDDSLRYALMMAILFMGWGVIHFFLASRHYRHDQIS